MAGDRPPLTMDTAIKIPVTEESFTKRQMVASYTRGYLAGKKFYLKRMKKQKKGKFQTPNWVDASLLLVITGLLILGAWYSLPISAIRVLVK